MKTHVVVCRVCAAERTLVSRSVHAAWSELRAEGWVAYWHAPASAPAHVVCGACDQRQRSLADSTSRLRHA